jgi:Family of unknown function (DUF6077)
MRIAPRIGSGLTDAAREYTGTQIRELLAKIGNRLIADPFESFCDWFFVFYAFWTLTWIASYFVNLSFFEIFPVLLVLVPLSVLTLAFKNGQRARQRPIAAVHARRDTLIVLGFVVAGILLTLFLHRPDSDDEQYLGMAFSLLANPDQPIQQLPGYGLTGFTAITAYEPLKATLSYIVGIPLLDSYYLLVPALMSALTVIVTYRLLRELVPEGWIIGMVFFFVVMLAWGDVHRTLANFGFVRMFQGKSVLVSAVVPALFLYFFLFLRNRAQHRYHSFLLAAVVVSGIGLSRGGLIICPLLLLFLALASIKFNTLGNFSVALLTIAGVSAAILLPFIYYNGWTLMNPSQLVYTSKGDVGSTTNLEMVEFTMGDGIRGIFLLACVGASFLFVGNKDLRYSYRNFLAVFFLLLLIPWTSNVFAKTFQEYLSWRWMWVTPVPVLASIAVGGALARIREASNYAVALGVFLVVAFGFTAASPKRVLSQENYTSVRWPGAKVDGNSIYLRPYQKTATIKDGKLYLDNYEKGF